MSDSVLCPFPCVPGYRISLGEVRVDGQEIFKHRLDRPSL